MADLITLARAKETLAADTSFSSGEDDTINNLIDACSAAIRKYCRREFDSQEFDHLFTGRMQRHLMLRETPIISVASVRYNPITVMKIKNTSSSNQRATAAATSSGLSLTKVASGSSDTDTSISWSGNATLSAVAAAVNALGSGWTAEVISGYEDWPSADIKEQGAYHCKDAFAGIKLHIDELSEFDIDFLRGWLTRNMAIDVTSTPHYGPCWGGGTNFWRVIYTAGYSSVPEDVQEACAEWIAHIYFRTQQ